MRSLVLAVVGMLGTFLYNMPEQELVPQPVAQKGLPDFDLSQTKSDVNQIEAEVKEIAPQLGAANDQLLQSISALSRQIGQMHSSMMTTEAVEEIVTTKTGHFVTANAMSDAIDEVKDQLKTAASECNCECEAKIADILKRLDALEAKCNAPVASQAKVSSTTTYGSYGTVTSAPRVSSGGSTGSKAQSYQPTVSYSETVICDPVVTSSYSVSSAPVVVGSGGSTGSVSYSQPVYSSEQAVVSVPQSSREVRIVEPRQPRRVSTAEIPDYTPSFSVQSQTCDPNDPYSPCAKAAQQRTGILGRVRGR